MLAADLSTKGIAYANSLDPDQAQQNVGLDQSFKLFANLILYLQNEDENIMLYIQFIWDNNLLPTYYPACKEFRLAKTIWDYPSTWPVKHHLQHCGCKQSSTDPKSMSDWGFMDTTDRISSTHIYR